MSSLSTCRLCGLPNPAVPLVDGDGAFCCFGCREIFRCFGDAAASVQRERRQEPATAPQGKTAYLWIDGMHCTSCEFLIDKLVLGTPGIHAATASYATSTAKVVYDPELIQERELPGLLDRFGYSARLRGTEPPDYDERQDLLRVLSGGCLAAFVMMLSMLFIYPIHAGLAVAGDFDAMRWVAFNVTPKALFVLSTILVFYVGLPILRGAWIGIRVRMLNMDSLLALSILATYGYSVVQLFLDPLDLYFEVAGTLVAVVSIGRFLERNARRRATRELHEVMRTWSSRATVMRNGESRIVESHEIQPGDRVFVRAAQALPVDGTVVCGEGAVDESLMTGEPFPVARGPGDKVLGGSVLLEGHLEIDAGTQVGSRIADLAQVLWNTQSSAAGIPGRVDRISRRFVPVVLILATGIGMVHYFGGAGFDKALLAALATLIVSCPCTFGLAVPLTTASAISSALRRGIIVTGADLFEKSPHVDVVAIDKTGTLSTGLMEVVEVIGSPELVSRAAAVERLSAHPVAKAIARLDAQRTARGEIEIHPGKGALADVGNVRVAVGSKSLFNALGWQVPPALALQLGQHATGECVVSYVGWEGVAHGAIVTRDRARPQWQRVVERLRLRSRVVLLTGAENAGAYAASVDEVHAGAPPEAKAAVIRGMKATGTVAMIGDGSNDAPALAAADLSIAFGAATALAAQSADMVIPGHRLDSIFDAFALLAATRSRVRQSLAWALAYNAVAIPMAMSGQLTPLSATLAMTASSILVVLNATRPIFAGEAEGATSTLASRGTPRQPVRGIGDQTR